MVTRRPLRYGEDIAERTIRQVGGHLQMERADRPGTPRNIVVCYTDYLGGSTSALVRKEVIKEMQSSLAYLLNRAYDEGFEAGKVEVLSRCSADVSTAEKLRAMENPPEVKIVLHYRQGDLIPKVNFEVSP